MDQFAFANVMQVPGVVKVVVNMGVGDAAGQQAHRGRRPRPDSHHRSEAGCHQGPQVDRPVQAARGYADRRPRRCAGTACGSSSTVWCRWPAAYPRLPWPVAQAVRRPGQLHLRSDRAVDVPRDRPGPRSTASAAWTSRSSRPRRPTTRDARCSRRSASRSRRTEHGQDRPDQQGEQAKPEVRRRATRCQRCGRPHSVYRKFGLCRICLREMAHRGEPPGVTKSSW